MQPKRGPGRPPTGKVLRITRTFSIHPDTEAKILAAAAEKGVSNGEMLDLMAKKLRVVIPSGDGTSNR